MNGEGITVLQDNIHKLPENDQAFASSLLSQFTKRGDLSQKQWYWVNKLAEVVQTPVDAVPDFTEQVEVGDFAKVIAFFKKAAEQLLYPKLWLQLGASPLTLSLATSRAKVPGSVSLLWDKVWVGRVLPTGELHATREMRSSESFVQLIALLEQLATDPVKVAHDYGMLTGHCCFCHSELSDERSKHHGYGPVCAKRWGLPWGDK